MAATPITIRVLIIDDDDRITRAVRGWLAEQGLDVLAFTSAQEGLKHASQSYCHVALVDLQLADADGLEVLHSLARSSPQTRLIALSAFPDVARVIAATRAGARDVLEKPLQPAALLEAVERQLVQLGLLARSEAELYARVGTRLRELRISAGRTLSDVSDASGLSTAQLSQIELGRNGVSLWALTRICGSLRVRLSEFFATL